MLHPQGFTAAFLVMLFPKPLSARQIVRCNIAQVIADTGDLYGKVISGIEDGLETLDSSDLNSKIRQDRHRDQLLKIMASAAFAAEKGSDLEQASIQVVQQQMAFAK